MISYHKRLGLLFAAALTVVLVAGCNETLRQFIVPVPKPTGDPNAFSHAVILSTNPAPSSNGSTLHIDVSGDTVAGVVPTGPKPVFLGKTLGRVFVINGDDTITSYIALSPIVGPFSTITLPTGPPNPATKPVFGGTTSVGNFYVTNRDSDNTSVISSAALAQTETITLPATSHQPVAIAGNAANSKMYIVNNGTNDVTVVSTTDNTIIKPSIPVGLHPIWGVMATNGVQVFIVNQGDPGATPPVPGSVSVIDTTLDIVIPCTGQSCDPMTGAITVGTTATSSPNFAFYDDKLQRLYVSNTGENTVSVIKADGIDLGVVPQVLPELLANIMLSAAPTSVVALSDSTRAYAALGGCPAGTNHTNITTNIGSCSGNLVSVIDVIGLKQIKTIPVGAGAVSIDAATDGSRVYVVGAQAGNISIIRTSTDSVNTTFAAPQQDLSCTSSCPLQTPFMVRVFP
jgi:DNA-binding beta-propeller fold protein YncE